MKKQKCNTLAFTMAIMLMFLTACTRQEKKIVNGLDFQSTMETCQTHGQRFCIVLLDTTQTTSQIYLQRLQETASQALFNIIFTDFTKSNVYEQWLYSDATPVTCIFSPDGHLTDIIPGASRKCFRCIDEVLQIGKMTTELEYYNNFTMDKAKIIPLLDEIWQCNLLLEKGSDLTLRLEQIAQNIEYPFLTYLEMENAIRNGDKEKTDSLALRLCSYEGDLDLELYPDLFITARENTIPGFDATEEANLNAPSVVNLHGCMTGKPKVFHIPVNNSGKKPLDVEGIEMSCSCLELFDDTDFTLMPGETRNLEFEFTADRNGQIEREIIIRNNGIYPIKRIRIIAERQAQTRKEDI